MLVDGDDLNDPVADAVRSILDGHIVLSRELAARNHFPAIDILQSTSRVMRDIVTPAHYAAAIVAMGPGKPEMLKPGAKILIFGATRAADGSLSAQSVVVGRDGLAPPM